MIFQNFARSVVSVSMVLLVGYVSASPSPYGALVSRQSTDGELPTVFFGIGNSLDCGTPCLPIQAIYNTCAPDANLNTTCLCTKQFTEAIEACGQCGIVVQPSAQPLIQSVGENMTAICTNAGISIPQPDLTTDIIKNKTSGALASATVPSVLFFGSFIALSLTL
ncbi:hypothetical protein SISSUDRAFT_1063947 [Sistotremastrum suecicum HHB10207 ss-3]|uniref:Extracellular membrane protein CFEM domain-containing protein n=1 Tax=Sistotremastrum suecicum HHB10207 ss-3 TaxID=1314776 RepID=A0A166B8C0_9AGAM|nr:hypothetical protein SISSUDRAFT_1063947 [Sistotremastrum suecicum HHB10207 ss-3]